MAENLTASVVPERHLMAAPPFVATAEGWKPIATAPHDGTPVILGWLTGFLPRSAWWEMGAWVVANTNGLVRLAVEHGQPTHWMSLPDSPVAS